MLAAGPLPPTLGAEIVSEALVSLETIKKAFLWFLASEYGYTRSSRQIAVRGRIGLMVRPHDRKQNFAQDQGRSVPACSKPALIDDRQMMWQPVVTLVYEVL